MLFVVVYINRYKVTTKSKQFPILLGKTGIRLLAYSNPIVINKQYALWTVRTLGNSVGVALSRRRYRSRNISGTVANITIINNKQGDTKTQKAVVTAVGFAWVALVATPVGKRVFLLIVPTIPTVMHGMTTAATTVKKTALGRSKSPPLAVQKQQLVDDPPNSPKGWDFILAAFVEVVVTLISLGEGSAGVSLGWLVTYVTSPRVKCYEPARVPSGV